jgi:hypothetical protein
MCLLWRHVHSILCPFLKQVLLLLSWGIPYISQCELLSMEMICKHIPALWTIFLLFVMVSFEAEIWTWMKSHPFLLFWSLVFLITQFKVVKVDVWVFFKSWWCQSLQFRFWSILCKFCVWGEVRLQLHSFVCILNLHLL